MKNKDAKDKEKLNRHQFVPGTLSGVLQCVACDRTLLGKESLQCSSKCLDLVMGLCCASPVSRVLEARLLLATFTETCCVALHM